jgi:hypothetical protein
LRPPQTELFISALTPALSQRERGHGCSVCGGFEYRPCPRTVSTPPLPPEQRDKAKAALATLAETLPFLIDLSAEDRASLPKFGEKNRSFVVKALGLAEDHPEILPASFSLKEFRADVKLVESLYPLRNAVESLFGKLDDTSRRRQPTPPPCWCTNTPSCTASGALEDSLDDLGQRFARKSKKPAAPPPRQPEKHLLPSPSGRGPG